MRRVAIKPAAQQADALTVCARELLIGQRTPTINALRGHAAEFSAVAATVSELPAIIAQDAPMPQAARSMPTFLGRQVEHPDREITVLDAALLAQHTANPVSRLPAAIPDVGPVGALTLAVRIDPAQFHCGLSLAALIGLTFYEFRVLRSLSQSQPSKTGKGTTMTKKIQSNISGMSKSLHWLCPYFTAPHAKSCGWPFTSRSPARVVGYRPSG